jgi:hypothetical protein
VRCTNARQGAYRRVDVMATYKQKERPEFKLNADRQILLQECGS